MKEIQSTIYVTNDGKEFANKQDALKHEDRLENVRAFVVRYNPDLTEGRGFQKSGIVWVHAKGSHHQFVEHWCYEKYGNKYAFCMGVYGSNAISLNWNIHKANEHDLNEYEVIHRIEENFVEKIWS